MYSPASIPGAPHRGPSPEPGSSYEEWSQTALERRPSGRGRGGPSSSGPPLPLSPPAADIISKI